MRILKFQQVVSAGKVIMVLLTMFSLRSLAATNDFDCLRILSNLPPIYELVFSVQQSRGLPLYYLLQCQESNYVVRESEISDRLHGGVAKMSGHDRCYGYHDGEYWRVYMFQFQAHYHHSAKNSLVQYDNSFTVGELHKQCIVPLCLGLQDVGDFRSISWKENLFTYRGLSKGEHYEGRIHRDDQGKVSSADYWIVPDKLERRWFLKFDYDESANVPKGFPSAYHRSFILGRNPERKLNSTRILSLVFATNQMPHETFQAQRFLDVPNYQENWQSNNTLYIKRSNTWVEVDQSDVPESRSPDLDRINP